VDNPFPSSPAALMQVQRAAAEHREVGEASQEAFERQLANAGEPHEATEAVRQTPPPEPPAIIQSVIERAAPGRADAPESKPTHCAGIY
jgi:hypothetical protein